MRLLSHTDTKTGQVNRVYWKISQESRGEILYNSCWLVSRVPG